MIAKFELKGVHTDIDAALQKYTTKKLGSLDKYLPRAHRDAAHAVVELKQVSKKVQDQKKYTCDVTLHLPKDTIHVAESTMNMFAAVDIVEAKLKLQIKKYKDSHGSGKLSRHLTAKFRRGQAINPLADESELS